MSAALVGAPIAGGAPTTLAPLTPCTDRLAADATHVYCIAGNVGIEAGPVGGGALQTVAAGSPQARSYLAVDGTNVYWVDWQNVYKAPIAGGAATAIASSVSASVGPNGPLVVDASHVYWALYQGVVATPK
jgi:hypothetical protein